MSRKSKAPYSESDDHVPNPTYQSGVVDTTGTMGDAAADINTVSPVFAQAKADALGGAVEALDDPDVDENETVVFNNPDPTREEQEEHLRQAAKDAAENKQLHGGPSPAAQQAAETGDKGNARADESPGRAGQTRTGSGPHDSSRSQTPAKKAAPAKKV